MCFLLDMELISFLHKCAYQYINLSNDDKMKYFETYFRKSSTRKSPKRLDDQREEILIHCDCSIFEWLISFMSNPNEVEELNLSLVLPVLIASDFLMMESAISFCISYISKNIHDLVHHANISLSCLKESLLTRIACELKSKDLMMISRSAYDDGGENMCALELMYKSKIEQEFCDEISKNKIMCDNDSKIHINCCVKCGRIYVNTENNTAICQKSCPASTFYVGYRGELSGQSCVPDTTFSLLSSLKLLRSKFNSWNKVYWQLKRIVCNSMIHIMIQNQLKANCCKKRTDKFLSTSFGRQCPTGPYFGEVNYASIWGVHSCCGKVVLKFNPWDFGGGCTIIEDSEMIENAEDIQLVQQIDLRNLIFKILGERDTRTFIELEGKKNMKSKQPQRENNMNPKLRPSSRKSRFESTSVSEDFILNYQYDSHHLNLSNVDLISSQDPNRLEQKMTDMKRNEIGLGNFSSREFLLNIPLSHNVIKNVGTGDNKTDSLHQIDKHNANSQKEIGKLSWLSALLLKGDCVGNHQQLLADNYEEQSPISKTNDDVYLNRDNASTFSKIFCTLKENQRNELLGLCDLKLDGVRKLSWMKHLRMEIDSKRTKSLIRTLIHLREKSDMNEYCG